MITEHEQQSASGQTLIETLVAVFMLVTGVTAALSLAIYALSSSTNITRQIIAAGLAREGVEAVKSMRDSNWLREVLLSNNCYNFLSSQPNQDSCYQNWLGKNGATNYYCINPSTGAGNNCNGNSNSFPYYIGFDPTTSNYWVFARDSSNYGMNYDPTNSANKGFYVEDGVTDCLNATSEFCRSITLTKLSPAPYNQDGDVSAELYVQSQVWWISKPCPRVHLFTQAPTGCRLELDTYLTNWKNY